MKTDIKVGDTVVCINNCGKIQVGQFLVVDSINHCPDGDIFLRFSKEDTEARYGWSADSFSRNFPAVAQKEAAGKTRMDILFRLPGLKHIADIFTQGETKYPSIEGDFNWRKGRGSKEYKMKLMAAALRHIFSYMNGQKTDPESGKPHLAHATCNLLMVADIEILEAA